MQAGPAMTQMMDLMENYITISVITVFSMGLKEHKKIKVVMKLEVI